MFDELLVLYSKKLWQIWQITKIRQLFFANFPVLQYEAYAGMYVSCALIVSHEDRGKDIDIAIF